MWVSLFMVRVDRYDFENGVWDRECGNILVSGRPLGVWSFKGDSDYNDDDAHFRDLTAACVMLARVGGEAFQHPDTRRDVCF